MNINAAKGLYDVMKTNIGPKGTIKMLVNGAGGTANGIVIISIKFKIFGLVKIWFIFYIFVGFKTILRLI